jgi:tetratricopeptide (TPR) repeat protein
MTRLIQRFSLVAAAAAAVVAIAMSGATFGQAGAMGIDEPAKPAGAPADKKDDSKDAKPAADTKAPDAKPADAKPADTKPADKKSDLDFREGYKLAYDAVYKRQDYARAIVILSALGHDDHPDVANLIGFANRKLGRTEDAKIWYEKALAADPNHSLTWQYYGMWHLERGDRARAEQHLERIQLICGQGCEEYTSLRDALNGNATY